MSAPPVLVARYTADPAATSMDLVSGRVARGTIVRSGAVLVLACPACAKMQFTAHAMTGPPDAPTVSEPIHCGAGYCKRCGVWFRIDAGVPEVMGAPPEPTPERPIPQRLRDAGVAIPPRHPSAREP